MSSKRIIQGAQDAIDFAKGDASKAALHPAMTDSKMPEPVATVTHITPGIIADGKQERGITLNWRATEDLKIGSKLYAHPAPVADAELEALMERLQKLADDMEKHATDEWDESEDVRKAITAIRARTDQPVGVRVKPLAWEAREDDSDVIVAGGYEIIHETHGYQLYFWWMTLGDKHKNRADAEAAAWEHHQKRILSALLPDDGGAHD